MGITVKARIENPIAIVGKNQNKLLDPNTIGDEINKPNIAFLESVRVIKIKKLAVITMMINFFKNFLLGLFNSDKQNGQTITIQSPA